MSGKVREVRLGIRTPHGEAPALARHLEEADRFRGTVLLYHGLGSCKEVLYKESNWLAEAGFLSIAVDAWGHGDRRLPDFDEATRGMGFYDIFPQLIRKSIEEIPSLVGELSSLLGDKTGGFGVAGISMGGYIAYGSALCEPRLAAIVPLLGSPEWRFPVPVDADFEASSPHSHAPAFETRALLAINAGQDTNVPPDPSRRFLGALKTRYPEGIHQYVEYDESSHFMREQDWNDAWRRTLEWFGEHLARR